MPILNDLPSTVPTKRPEGVSPTIEPLPDRKRHLRATKAVLMGVFDEISIADLERNPLRTSLPNLGNFITVRLTYVGEWLPSSLPDLDD